MNNAIPNFQKCKEEATRLLLSQTSDFPVQIRSLLFSRQIIIDSLQHFSHITKTPLYQFTNQNGLLKNGCTVIMGSVYLVLYNVKESNLARLNWTLAHEIGHIYLNHKKDGDLEEIEANFFASELLMPEILIRTLEKQKIAITASSLSEIFQVSRAAASKKIQTIKKRADFFPSKEEKQLLTRQEDFLNRISARYQKKSVSYRSERIQQLNDCNLAALETIWLHGND